MAKHAKRRRHAKHRRPAGRRAGNFPSGRIDITSRGYGFVETEEGTFYIPAKP